MKIMFRVKYYRIDKIVDKESLRYANEMPCWAYWVFSNTSERAQGFRMWSILVTHTNADTHARLLYYNISHSLLRLDALA